MNRFAVLSLAATGLVFAGSAQAATAVVQGEYTLNVTVVLTTAIPSGGTANCSLSVQTTGDAAGANIESITVPMSVSGSTGTCKLVIPYYWELATPTTDIISASYIVAIVGGSAAANPQSRSGDHTLPSIVGVPVTGTHTVENATTRL